jgi:hypothetical protein
MHPNDEPAAADLLTAPITSAHTNAAPFDLGEKL